MKLEWLDERDALVVHDRVLALHGGAPGVRDRGLLQSALARPRQHHSYGKRVGIVQLASIYTAAIVQNHPFVDGNKRVGFVLGVLFLELNGYDFIATEEEASQAVFALADGTLDEQSYVAWLQRNSRRKPR